MEKTDIKSCTLEELTQEMLLLNEKTFRAKQVYEWIHKKLVSDFDEMSNISKELREKLTNHYSFITLRPVEIKTSIDSETSKYLFELNDGRIIESVLMKYKHGNSVCISSQVGCRMGCRFCASTLGGLERNLSASEMLSQIYQIQKISGERVSNVVVMGTGEPLDNYEQLLRFIRIISDENGLNISQRNITVSTCGIIEKIKTLAMENLQITLAISLHAPNDGIRRKLMPVAERYTVYEILDACNDYFKQTGRRISFEYSLVEGMNDSRENALELADLLKGFTCHVNLIPVNPIKERDFKHTKKPYILNFKNILEKNKINVTIRREMGTDIDAACGQLRKSYMDKRNADSR